MFVKPLLPLVAAYLFATPALAQAAGAGQQSQAAPDPRAQMIQTETQLHAGEIRRAWIASGHQAPPAVVTTCEITSGKIVGTNLNVNIPPAAPKLQISFQNCPTAGFSRIYAWFYAPTSQQQLSTSYEPFYLLPPVKHGIATFQVVGEPYGNGAFNPYSEAGEWTLKYINIYDNTGNFRQYGPTDLAGLFPSGVQVHLTNNQKPDIAAPLFTSGAVLTPKVSLSSSWPAFGVSLGVSDNAAGVKYTQITVCPPTGGSSCAGAIGFYEYLGAPLLTGTIKNYDYLCNQSTHDCSSVPKGTWTIYGYYACDMAFNCGGSTNAADVQSLFGTTTFKVTQ
ncbi:MAG TPA: hypothetical protein VGG69_11820 [Rhizomicrobium sp.]